MMDAMARPPSFCIRDDAAIVIFIFHGMSAMANVFL
jgi:hypothetical protein